MTANRIAIKLNLNVKTVYQRLKNKGLFQKDYDYDYDHDVYLEICHEKYSDIKRFFYSFSTEIYATVTNTLNEYKLKHKLK